MGLFARPDHFRDSRPALHRIYYLWVSLASYSTPSLYSPFRFEESSTFLCLASGCQSVPSGDRNLLLCLLLRLTPAGEQFSQFPRPDVLYIENLFNNPLTQLVARLKYCQVLKLLNRPLPAERPR